MTESRFFKRPSGLTVGEIVSMTGAEPRDGVQLAHRITNVAPIDLAGPADLTFIDNPRFVDKLASTRAGACLMSERFENRAPSGLMVLRAREPYRAFVTVARKFYPDSLTPTSLFESDGVSPGAFVHPSARLASGVKVDPAAVIGPRAEIGAGTVIAANAVIGPDVRIGRDCAIGAGSSIIHTLIGDRVIIHPGCHIGQDGFGYVSNAQGHLKVPQVGSVIIHDDVEIGAGTNVDRGGIRDTVIGEGTKIDNLVQIGHNVVIGSHCIIVGQSGLAGSATLEDFVVLAGRVGILPHVTVGKGAEIAALSTVMRDVPRGARWGGFPNAKPVKQFFREMAVLERLSRPGIIITSSATDKGDQTV
jgi:UDP-3-O-[3-hydroxymyristoyl] glucosamine N-acyltransferase